MWNHKILKLQIKIFENDSSILQKLTHNSSMFLNLNISSGKLFSTNSINKLKGIFELFSGISPNFSLYGIFWI